MAGWFRIDAIGTVTLRIRAQPGARHTQCAGVHGECLRIRVAAPALEGRANDALIEFVAEAFGVPRRAVTLLAGARSREKRLEVRGSTRPPAAALGMPP